MSWSNIRAGSTVTEDPHALKIYIDGNAYDNPGGAGGYAGMAVYPDDWDKPQEIVFQVGFKSTSNNRMELSALIAALKFVREEGSGLGVQRVQIVTDSMYVYNGVRWALGWKQNGWKTRDGRPVENSDLWDSFLSARTKVKVRTDVIWKKGKRDALLRAIDKAAKEAGKEPWEIDRGFREGKVARSKVGGKSASQLFPAKGQEVTIHVYRSGLVGRTSHKIYFDFYSPTTKSFDSKYRAGTTAELALELHRGHVYRVRFNTNERNPMIEEIVEEIDPDTLL